MLATNKKVKLTHNRLEVSLLTKDKSFDETFFPPLPLLKETITHVNDISSLVDTGEFTNQHDSIFHCTELLEDSYPSALRVLNLAFKVGTALLFSNKFLRSVATVLITMYNAEQNNEFIRQLNADEWTRVFNFFKGQFMIDISARDHSTSNNGRPFLPANCCACYYRSGDLGDCRKIYLNRD